MGDKQPPLAVQHRSNAVRVSCHRPTVAHVERDGDHRLLDSLLVAGLYIRGGRRGAVLAQGRAWRARQEGHSRTRETKAPECHACAGDRVRAGPRSSTREPPTPAPHAGKKQKSSNKLRAAASMAAPPGSGRVATLGQRGSRKVTSLAELSKMSQPGAQQPGS